MMMMMMVVVVVAVMTIVIQQQWSNKNRWLLCRTWPSPIIHGHGLPDLLCRPHSTPHPHLLNDATEVLQGKTKCET
jgi:hypothetical protein